MEQAGEQIINVGLVAHVDAGKTTTTEQLLYLSGQTRSVGSVDAGTARTDWLDVERERGISVRAASAVLQYGGVRVNLLDTPGHVDFAGEVERALAALDAAVLILSAAEGVQSHTLTLWRALAALGIPVILYINKIDRVGCDVEAVLASMRAELSGALLVLNRPKGEGSRACTAPAVPFTDEASVLALADQDDALAERYLSGDAIGAEQLEMLAAQLTAQRRIFPVVFGASALGVGVDCLLSAMATLLPRTTLKEDGALSGVVYRVEHDAQIGKLAHVRLFGGSVANRDAVPLTAPGGGETRMEKVTQIRRFQGEKYQDVGKLSGGDSAALCGLVSARTGDILGSAPPRVDVHFASPLFTVQVMPDNPADLTALVAAMGELADEDPLLDFEWLRDERELHIKIMGPIQLEVLGAMLASRYGLSARFTAPSVIYKETVAKSGVGFEAYTMPKPCWAVVELAFDPLSRGAGYRFRSEANNTKLFKRYQNHIETAVPQALKQGLLGWEVTDVAVTLTGGEHHLEHTHPLDFFVATPMAVMNGLENCGTVLLEPLQTLRVIADEGLLGKTVGDMVAMRAEFDSPVTKDGKFTLEARVPVAESMDYPTRFAALTSGRGNLRTAFAGYAECPPGVTAVAKRRGVDPRDRAKWILHHRNAL